MAELERSVYACLRMTRDMTIMMAEPASIIGGWLNAISNVIPRTEPGTMYGNMAMVSMALVSQLLRLTARYAMSMPRTTIITIAARQ